MMFTRRCLVLLIAVVLFCGCSSEPANRVPVYQVKGKVTYKGQPAAGADIIFTNSEAQRSAFGRTDADGHYQLTTFSSNDGAVEGKHSVSIIQVPVTAETVVLPETESEEYQPPGIGESTMPVETRSTLPKKYADQTLSGLTAVVNPDNSNVINFDLTD